MFTPSLNYKNIGSMFISTSTGSIAFTIQGNNTTTVVDLKQYITNLYNQNNPIIIYFPLKTPELVECTKEQCQILNQIRKEAHSYKNITHLYSNNEIQPIYKVEVLQDLNAIFLNINNKLSQALYLGENK